MTAHGHPLPTLKVDDLVASMDDRSRGLYALSVVLCLLGVVGFIAGVLSDPQRAWTALVWNWSLWSGIAVGGAAVVAAASASYGLWLRPMRRIAEGLTAFLPVSFLIMLVMLFGLEHVYEWVEHPVAAKAKWLDPTFFSVRQIVGLAILYGTALALVYWSMRPDVGRLRDRVHGWRRNLYDRLTSGWEGEDVELERAAGARAKLAPAYVVIYAVVVSFWAWDWLMSIDQHWFSTLFPAWIFMTYFLAALVVTAIMTCRLRAYPPFASAVPLRYLHDIGKMVFAFTIFWTYLFFAQYLVIWYGRLPEETGFVKLRLWGAYEPIAIAVLACVFLIPFLGLLGIHSKRNPVTLTLFSLVSLFGLWLFHLLLVAPSPYPDFIAFGWIEALVAIGMAGTFATCFLTFVRAFPPLAIAAGLPTEEDEMKLRRETGPLHD
jgi:hypothetical protein